MRAGDHVLVLHTLRFHDELVRAEDLEIERRARKPSEKEVRMAGQLVSALADDFEPSAYEDTYRDAVLDLIKRKSGGEEIDTVEGEEPALATTWPPRSRPASPERGDSP